MSPNQPRGPRIPGSAAGERREELHRSGPGCDQRRVRAPPYPPAGRPPGPSTPRARRQPGPGVQRPRHVDDVGQGDRAVDRQLVAATPAAARADGPVADGDRSTCSRSGNIAHDRTPVPLSRTAARRSRVRSAARRRRSLMSTLLLLTSALQPSAEVLPGARAARPPGPDPARRGQRAARRARRRPGARRRPPGARPRPRPVPADPHHRRRRARCCSSSPRAGWPWSPHDWGMDDVVLAHRRAGRARGPDPARDRPAARRARGRRPRGARDPLRRGGRSTTRRTPPSSAAAPLDLTFKEFELLKYLAQHPGRVFTREQLLQEVWGYDYFGGTRTVDVHVRRLRAKLGPEHETADRHRAQRRLPVRAAAQGGRASGSPRTP